MNLFKMNRRSFLQGSALTIATFVVGSVVNPVKTIAKATTIIPTIQEQKAILEASSAAARAGKIIPRDMVKVHPTAAERAFLLGFKRIGHDYAKLLRYVDVEPWSGGFQFSGKVGTPGDQCSFKFECSDLIATDFEYMDHVTKKTYSQVVGYFQMSSLERRAANGRLSYKDYLRFANEDLYYG